PTASDLTITSNPQTDDDLQADWTYTDVDSDNENSSWIIRWYKDNALESSYNNLKTVPSSATSKNEVWNYTVQVYDGTNYSNQYISSTTIIINSNPVVTSLSFNKTSGVTSDDTINITYTFNDVDSDEEDTGERIVYWYWKGIYNATKDNDTILDNSETAPNEFWYYILRAFDGTSYSQNYTSSPVTIGTVPNDPPEAGNLTLTLNPTTSDNLIADYDYYDNQSHQEAGTEIRWYKNGVLQTHLNDTKTVLASETAKGEEWYFSVKPKDGLAFGDLVSITNVTIQNTLPTASDLTIITTPQTDDDLQASWIYADIDEDPENISWIICWYRNNVQQSSYNNLTTVPSSATSKNEIWNFTVVVYDGQNYSITYSSAETTIVNTAPTALGVTLTDSPLTNDSLTASWTFADADSDDENSSWIIEWFKDSVKQASFDNLTTVPSSTTSKNEFWHYTIHVYDGTNYSIEYTSPSRKILNTRPFLTDYAITINPNTTVDLEATWVFHDYDGDGESTTRIIRWYKNNVLQSESNNLKFIPSSATSKGEVWNYTVQVYDGTNYSIQYNSSTTTILNTAPFASDLTITSIPLTTDNLVASWTYADVDEDPEDVSYHIRWYRNGGLVSSLNDKKTVESGNTSKNEVWNYTVQVYDGTAFSIQYNSSTTTILNTIPTATTLTLTPTPTTTDNLQVSYSFIDVDDDSEPSDSWIIRWYRNGNYLSAYDDQKTVPSSATAKEQFWYNTLQVYDNEDYSILYTSPQIQIINSAPSTVGLTFNPMDPTTVTNLSVSYSFSDDDSSDSESGTIIRWYRNNILQTTYNDLKTVDSGLIVKDDLWNVSIKISDGSEFGNWQNASVSIKNSAPSVVAFSPDIYVPPTGLFTTNMLVATWNEWDPDGDTISNYMIVWYQNLNPVPLLENMTEVSSNYTTKDDNWRFYINIFDGEDWSDPLGDPTSWKYGTTTIDNSEPYVENITLSGGLTTTDDVLLFYDFYDADGDPENSKIEWKIIHQGSVNTVEGTVVLSEAEFTAGDLIWVVITPDDNDGGMLTGQLVDSSTLSGSDVIKQVGDTAPEINTTQGFPTILADHPNGTYIYSAIYPIYLNYTSFIVDIDSGESNLVFDVDFQVNPDVQFANITENIGAQYRWYKYNNTSGKWEFQEELTSSVISGYHLNKDDQWMGSVRPRDNYGFFGSWVNTSSITIGNSYPEVLGFTWLTPYPTTDDNIQFSFDYFDWDGDPIVMSKTVILWLKNGVIINGAENNTVLFSLYFVKGDEIRVIIRPYDGTNWAVVNYTTTPISIVNFRPTITSSSLLPLTINGDEVLCLNWSYFDGDGDPEHPSYRIDWYNNGENQSSLTNSDTIPFEYINNDDLWQAHLWVFDGTDYSGMFDISLVAKVISLHYVFDEQTSRVDPDIRVNEFFVEDENITVSFQFTSMNDADNSRIQWYKLINNSWIEQTTLENQSEIHYGETSFGEQWYCTITPFDILTGYTWFRTNSSIITIESRPVMISGLDQIITVQNDTECHYLFNIITNDQRNDVSFVELSFNDTISEVADESLLNENEWNVDFEISDALVRTYLNTVMVVEIKVITRVHYSGQTFDIYSIYTLNFTVKDEVAPRVSEPRWIFDDETDPTNITFYAGVIDHGSEITSVTLYYYFNPVNASEENGNGASTRQSVNYDYRTAEMIYHNISDNGIPIYSIVVPFDHNGTSREIIYYIVSSDSSGNSGIAYDILRDEPNRVSETKFNYRPLGINPMFVVLIVVLTIFVAIFGSIVYVKFIRKPELIGLDKELVLEHIKDITKEEITDSLDAHTIGVVISFFDQRHGPIPIIIMPELLKDNYAKLVELSDRSFSGTGFCDDFEMEITSSYDFVIAGKIRTKVISFGYALDRPEARGGQENLTANIILFQDIYPLVNQFLNEVQEKVHFIHLLMNNEMSKKQDTIQMVLELRKFVSNIVLSYERIYGTTDLLEED
ncbi:MAG: hypothetical protein ACXACB_02045, partial [Promethearchaeota archaeon]